MCLLSPANAYSSGMNEISGKFLDFAGAFRSAAPMYSRFAARVAREPGVVDLMTFAERTQRIPVLLFACVHFLLLREPDNQLCSHYPNMRPFKPTRLDPGDAIDDAFIAFILDHRDELMSLLATRSTQTNEVGRCSWLLFPLALLEDEVGEIARVDVGSSAGLTLLFPKIDFELHPGGVIGTGGALTLRCETRGEPPRIDHVPKIAWSVGFDSHPIDLFNEDHIQWLEACVWPEQVERFDRLVAAVDLARRLGIVVEPGDAVTDIRAFVERASRHGHPVVTASWVLNYLTPAERIAFVTELDSIGADMNLSWVIAESPQETPELPVDGDASEAITVVSLVTWRAGRRTSVRLATAHPHGDWINWGS